MNSSLLLKLFILVLVISLYSKFISCEDWTQLQFDVQRTGYSPEQVNTPTTVSWRWNTDQATAVKIAPMVQPIVGSNLVFIGDINGKMHALNINNGSEVWSYQTGGPILHTAGYSGGQLFFGSHDKYVYALNASDGKLNWRFKTGEGIWTAPLIYNNKVYVTSRDKYCYCLNALNGDLIWSYQTGGPIYNSPACATDENTIFFGSEDMYMYALDMSSGTLKWKTKCTGISFRDYWPVVSEKHDVVMIRTRHVLPFHDAIGQSGTFHALSTINGSVKFTANITYTGGTGGTPTPPVLNGTSSQADTAYVISRGAYMSTPYIAEMNLTNGSFVWEVQANNGDDFRLVGDESSSLSIAGNNLYISMTQALGGWTMPGRTGFHCAHEIEDGYEGYRYKPDNLAVFFDPVIPIYSSESGSGHCAPPWAPGVISNGKIFWISDGSGVIAVAP